MLGSSISLPFLPKTSSFLPSLLNNMSVLSHTSEESSDGFFSISIKDYNHEECLQLAQIRIWTGHVLEIFWCPDKNEIVIKNDNNVYSEFIAQPDDAHIIRSLAHLCGAPVHQIRFSNLVHFSRDGAPIEQPGDDGLYQLYDSDWRSYGEEGLCFQVVAEIDFESDGHFIPPATDALNGELDIDLDSMLLS